MLGCCLKGEMLLLISDIFLLIQRSSTILYRQEQITDLSTVLNINKDAMESSLRCLDVLNWS